MQGQYIIGRLDIKDTTDVHIVKMKNGRKMRGRVIDISDGQFTFIYERDTLQFPIKKVKKVKVRNKKGRAPIPPSHPLYKKSQQADSLASPTLLHYKIVMVMGSELKVDIEEVYKKKIVVSYRGNVLEIPIKDISSIVEVHLIEGKEEERPIRLFEIHGHENLFLGPTSYQIESGHFDYTTYYGLLHLMEFAANDHLSFTGGYLFPNIALGSVKLASNRKSPSNFNATVSHIRSINQDFVDPIWIFSVGYTIGNPLNNMTINIGRSNQNGRYYNDKINLINIGGVAQLSDSWRLLGELLIGRAEDSYNSFALGVINVGWFNQKNRVDFGIGMNLDLNFLGAAPLIAYSHRF